MAEDQNIQDFRPLLAAHGPSLVLFAAQFLPTRQDAEDVMQQGFIQFWSTRHRAQDPLAYLYTCVRSAALDYRRAARRRVCHESKTPPSLFAQPDPVAMAEVREGDETLIASIGRLPEDQRQILVLKTWSGLTFAQIAAILRISPNTAASRYRYALAGLQKFLAASPEKEDCHDCAK